MTKQNYTVTEMKERWGRDFRLVTQTVNPIATGLAKKVAEALAKKQNKAHAGTDIVGDSMIGEPVESIVTYYSVLNEGKYYDVRSRASQYLF